MDNALLSEQIPLRHSVRHFTEQPIEGETFESLRNAIAEVNAESGLNFQLALNEPRAISGILAKYGMFRNADNYIACVGPDSADLEERVGYWGEKLVLFAQSLGLNTCWIAGTYSKGKTLAELGAGEKIACIIAIGYGQTPGKERKSKKPEKVSNASAETPDWFFAGVQAALLAPTAINQQKFRLTYGAGGKVALDNLGGPYSNIDLGIVRCHFELGSGKGADVWG